MWWKIALGAVAVLAVGVFGFLYVLGSGLTHNPTSQEVVADIRENPRQIRATVVSVERFASAEEARQAGVHEGTWDVWVEFAHESDGGAVLPERMVWVRPDHDYAPGQEITVIRHQEHSSYVMDPAGLEPTG